MFGLVASVRLNHPNIWKLLLLVFHKRENFSNEAEIRNKVIWYRCQGRMENKNTESIEKYFEISEQPPVWTHTRGPLAAMLEQCYLTGVRAHPITYARPTICSCRNLDWEVLVSLDWSTELRICKLGYQKGTMFGQVLAEWWKWSAEKEKKKEADYWREAEQLPGSCSISRFGSLMKPRWVSCS